MREENETERLRKIKKEKERAIGGDKREREKVKKEFGIYGRQIGKDKEWGKDRLGKIKAWGKTVCER